MMQANKQIVAFMVAVTLVAPTTLFAEDGADDSDQTSAPVPTLYREDSARPEVRPLPIRAEERQVRMASTSEAREEMREKREAERAEKMEERKELREEQRVAREERLKETRMKMMEKRLEVMKRFIAQQTHRMEKMIERLEKIADRVESRIEKFEGKERPAATTTGSMRDFTVAKSALERARGAIQTAKDALASAKSAVETTVANAEVRVITGDYDGDGTPDEAVDNSGAKRAAMVKVDLGKSVREELVKAREAIKTAHKALVEAIKAVKGGKVSDDSSSNSSDDSTGGSSSDSTDDSGSGSDS